MLRRIASTEDFVRAVILLALVVAFGIWTNGVSSSTANLANILVQSAIIGVAACGQALIMVTGGLDLSVSGIVALALMVSGTMLTGNADLSLFGFPTSIWLALPAAVLVGSVFGLINGALVAWVRIPALLATLGMWQITGGLAYRVTGTGYVDQLPAEIDALSRSAVLPIPILTLLTVVAVMHCILHRTTFGAEVYAVGGSARSANISGVSVRRVRTIVFVISGLLYGICAALSLSYYNGATMAQASGLELETIAAAVIGGVSLSGGKGTIFGVLLGVLILSVVGNGLNILGMGPTSQSLVKGVLLAAVVVVNGTVNSQTSSWWRLFAWLGVALRR